MTDRSIVVLSGGIGGSKLVLGLAHLLPAQELTVVVNTGDDFNHLGLHISPDIDTLLYTLAGKNNPETGWGQSGETWACMKELMALGGETWFQLGDKDLAIHLYRTARLNKGATLGEVTNELRLSMHVHPNVIPMSNDPVRTQIVTGNGTLAFQDYFVRERCLPTVKSIQYLGSDCALPAAGLTDLFNKDGLEAIIISPSNPYLSIDPILAIPGMQNMIKNASVPVIAVSPIILGNAVKGPTAKIMVELGKTVSAYTVASHYKGLINGFILDECDAEQSIAIQKMGIKCLSTNINMQSLDDKIALAQNVLGFSDTFRK